MYNSGYFSVYFLEDRVYFPRDYSGYFIGYFNRYISGYFNVTMRMCKMKETN